MGAALHSETINADAEAVWSYLGDFNGLARWHPDVKSSMLEDGGRTRRLTLHNGAEIIEQLIEIDPLVRRCRYSITASPLPVARHEAAIAVQPNGAGSIVDWRCDFESAGPPDSELVPLFQQIFRTGLAHLKTMLEV